MRYFVIMGNTRVGSTWLQAGMHALPSIYCTREIRWRMPYMEAAPPVHTYIDSTTTSIKERLEFGRRAAGKGEAGIVGAKLKFDPYGYVPPSSFDDLARIVEDDVYVIFLRRSYFEIFQTWKAFGIRHLANPNAKAPKAKPEGEEAARLNRFRAIHSVPLEQKRIFITSGGHVIARYLHNRYSGGDNLYYSVADAIDDMLVLFYNDLMALAVIEGRADADVLYYQDIRATFFDVTRTLGLPVSPENCVSILDNASTSRIEPPGVDLVYPSDALKEISDCLDALFHEVRKGERTRDQVVHYDPRSRTVSFDLPGLPAVFARHEETLALLRPATRSPVPALRRFLNSDRLPLRLRKLLAPNAQAHDETWLARRPIYVPVAAAPPVAVPAAKAVANRGSTV
jgi:hypothetical protein